MPTKQTSKLSGKTVTQRRLTDAGKEYYALYPTETAIKDTSNFFPITQGDFGRPIYGTFNKQMFDSMPENVKVKEYLNNKDQLGYSDSVLEKLAKTPPSEQWLKSQPRPQFPGITPGQAYGGMIPSYGFGSWIRDNSKTILGGATMLGGAALTAFSGGALAPVGIGLMASGAGQMVGGITENRQLKEQEAAQMQAAAAQGVSNQKINSMNIGQQRLQAYNSQQGNQSYSAFAANGGIIPSYGHSGSMMPKKKASGGYMEAAAGNPDVTIYANGGTHEENPYGGIPLGNRAKVEEGEVKVKLKRGDFIFPDRF